MNRRMWRSQMEPLAEYFHVIATDLPGHGGLSGDGFDLDAAAGHVAEILDAHAGGPALIAGLSLGGYVAMVHAANHPDQVAGLVLSGCSVNYGGLLGIAAKVNAAAMKLMTHQRFAALQDRLLRRAYPGPVVDSIAGAGFSLNGGIESLRQVATRDFLPLLRRYSGPALILNGANDSLSRKGEARLASSGNAECRIIPDAGHICNLDQPGVFNEEVHRFARLIGHCPAP